MDTFVKYGFSGLILFIYVDITVSYAVEMVFDEKLADVASQNSIISGSSQRKNPIFLIEEDSLKQEMPAYQSIKLFNIHYPNSFERVTGTQKENSTQDFGSEPYSYRWAGNYQDIYNPNQSNQFFFNQQSGYYQLSNVRGMVKIQVAHY